jgi:hypothetical protein
MMTDGPRKPSLHELSRQLPSGDEYATFIDSLHEIDARAAALVLASFIDSMLERAIDLNFLLLSRKKDNALFRDKGAPLSSFSAKIAVAHALGIFDDEYRDQLDRFRAIRNTFAHAIRPFDFNEPTIATECLKLDPRRLMNEGGGSEVGREAGPKS